MPTTNTSAQSESDFINRDHLEDVNQTRDMNLLSRDALYEQAQAFSDASTDLSLDDAYSSLVKLFRNIQEYEEN